jgi:hypothetical protein
MRRDVQLYVAKTTGVGPKQVRHLKDPDYREGAIEVYGVMPYTNVTGWWFWGYESEIPAEVTDEKGRIAYSHDSWIERDGDRVVFHGGRDGKRTYDVGIEDWVEAVINPESLAYLEERL